MEDNKLLQSLKLFGYPILFLTLSVFLGKISFEISFHESFLKSLSGAELILIGVIALIDLNFQLKKKSQIVSPKYQSFLKNTSEINNFLILAFFGAYIVFKLEMQKFLLKIENISINTEYTEIFSYSLIVGIVIIVYCFCLIFILKKTYGTN